MDLKSVPLEIVISMVFVSQKPHCVQWFGQANEIIKLINN